MTISRRGFLAQIGTGYLAPLILGNIFVVEWVEVGRVRKLRKGA